MNIIVTAQILASILLAIVSMVYVSFAARSIRLRLMFSRDYIKAIQTNSMRRLYPFVPGLHSKKYAATKRFLTSVGWRISVEEIYLLKWGIFSLVLFILVTMQTTNASIELNDIVQDINYRRNFIELHSEDNVELVMLERQLYKLVDKNLSKGAKLSGHENRQLYIEYIERLISEHYPEFESSRKETAQRMYYKLLQIRNVRSGINPYIYIFLISTLAYHLPDILGHVKSKLIEDKKNWEILNCMIIFSIFGRLPPYSILNILEHMTIATEVYKPLLEALIEGLKKGGDQEQAFEAALKAVDRDEMYELIETMKLAKRTGLIIYTEDMDESISNTIRWIEIENISRRRSKMLYAMSAVAIVIALGCIYFAYGLTVISDPSKMILR